MHSDSQHFFGWADGISKSIPWPRRPSRERLVLSVTSEGNLDMVSMRTAVAGVLTALALAGCSSSSSGSGPTITSFTAAPTSLPTVGGSVTLSWAVTGATSLSIDHGVGSVTPVTAGTATAQVMATTTFTLTATNSGGSSTSTAQVTVAPSITVAGTVTDESGVLATGETVLITSGTFSQSTVTDANGAFSVADVPTPYNATVIDSGGGLAVEYQGLTRPDPTLIDFTSVLQPETASIAGALTGGAFPQSGGATSVLFSSPQTALSSSHLPLVSNGPDYSGFVKWVGPSSTTGTLYALQWHSSGGLPTDYPGYGTVSNVLLQNGASYTGQTIALNSVTTGTLSGTLTAPTGYALDEQDLYFEPDAGVFFPIVNNVPLTTSTFTFTTPDIPNTSLLFIASVTGTDGEGLLKTAVSANTTGLSLSIPPPATLTLPVDGATAVTVTTPFSWTNFTGVTFVLFSGTPSFVVVTAASTATLPDLTAAGLPLPSSASYTWDLIGVGPATTVDAVAVPGGFFGLVYGVGYLSETVGRTFTTSP